MSPLATESQLIDLRNEITAKEAEADTAYAAAEKLVADMREAGTDPLKDADAFTKVDDAYKAADAPRQEAVDLRKRADLVMRTLGLDPQKRTDKDPETRPAPASNIGRRFIEHENFARVSELAKQNLRAAASFMQANPTEVATADEVEASLRAVTMPTSPSALIPPDYRPPVDVLYRPTRILDLITIGQTGSDMVQYVIEVPHGPAAAETAYGDPTVADSGVLPEEDFEWVPAETTPKRIGAWTPARESQLADAGQLATLINKGLTTRTRQHTEDRAVSGNGVGENLKGILATTGIGSVTKGSTGHTGETALDALHRGITTSRLAFVEPNGIGMDPVDFEQDIVLAKDTVGNYLFKIGEPTSVWGKPVAITTAVPNGTAIVGDFAHAILLIRSPMVVLASNEHADYFIRGLVAVKVEYRAAFYVDRPAAFTEVDAI